MDYGQNLLNSVLISGSVAIGAVVISVLPAYAPGIGRIRGRLWIVVVSPLYWLATQVGLFDTRPSLIIIFTVIPAVLFFLLFQRTLTRGITAGAVK